MLGRFTGGGARPRSIYVRPSAQSSARLPGREHARKAEIAQLTIGPALTGTLPR